MTDQFKTTMRQPDDYSNFPDPLIEPDFSRMRKHLEAIQSPRGKRMYDDEGHYIGMFDDPIIPGPERKP